MHVRCAHEDALVLAVRIESVSPIHAAQISTGEACWNRRRQDRAGVEALQDTNNASKLSFPVVPGDHLRTVMKSKFCRCCSIKSSLWTASRRADMQILGESHPKADAFYASTNATHRHRGNSCLHPRVDFQRRIMVSQPIPVRPKSPLVIHQRYARS